MASNLEIPRFENQFPDLESFIDYLIELYSAGKIDSWDSLEKLVKDFFSPSKMEQMESVIPGWGTMASSSEGITLIHVMGAVLGMYMLPEFLQLSLHQQGLMKWIILFHDVDKFHIRWKRDTMHAFRSAVSTANRLPNLGFPPTEKYSELIRSWCELTIHACIANEGNAAPIPDNRKLPDILQGIEQLFGQNTPATLIVKTVLFHISLHVDDNYPTPAPLTKEEIIQYIDIDLFPLLRVMMLSDNEGWSLFEPETRARQRKDTLAVFEGVKGLILPTQENLL